MKNLLIAFLMVSSLTVMGQDAKKMAKNLKFSIVEKLDSQAAYYFKPQNPDKHGFDNVVSEFVNAFIVTGISINVKNPRYIISMEYSYNYVISRYTMQYSSMTAQIIDTQKDGTIVGIVSYRGNFDLDALSLAIARKIKG